MLGSQAWRALQRLQAEADGAAQRLQQLLAEAQRMARAHEAGDIDAVMPLDAFEGAASATAAAAAEAPARRVIASAMGRRTPRRPPPAQRLSMLDVEETDFTRF